MAINFYLNKRFAPFKDAHWERTVQDILSTTWSSSNINYIDDK